MTAESVLLADVDDDDIPPKTLLRISAVNPGNIITETLVYFEICEHEETAEQKVLTSLGSIGVYADDLRAALGLLLDPPAPEIAAQTDD